MTENIRNFAKQFKYFLVRAINSVWLFFYFLGRKGSWIHDTAQSVNEYVDTLKDPSSEFEYFYSHSSAVPSLYGSVYACMTFGMTGRLSELSSEYKASWIAYFDAFQDERSGLFIDPKLNSELYTELDWWGARHVTLHMVSAYAQLGGRPEHRFHFLDDFRSKTAIHSWLEHLPWHHGHCLGDIDNKIMNIGCALQYERDVYNCEKSKEAIEALKTLLLEKRCPSTLLWGGFNLCSAMDRSRAIQFAYHLYTIFFFDDDFSGDADVLAGQVLKTQTAFGGFGGLPNSSACEDIDSIDILIAIYDFCSREMKLRIDLSLRKARSWIFQNQTDEGGFVFRLNSRFVFGSKHTSSLRGEAGMLGTWFRLLSLCHLSSHFSLECNYGAVQCQGYEFI